MVEACCPLATHSPWPAGMRSHAQHAHALVNAGMPPPDMACRGKANGEVFEDTYARGKPLVLFFQGRPFTGGLCLGVEQAMATMKAGGKRIIKVGLAFGCACI